MIHNLSLDFTIVIYHDFTRFNERQLRSTVSQCFGPILYWSCQPRREVFRQRLNLKEPPFTISCRVNLCLSRSQREGYFRPESHTVFRQKIQGWLKNIFFYALPNERPWIELCSNEAFVLTRSACHKNVPVFLCSFGSLVWCSEFATTLNLCPELTADFYHDTRVVEITAAESCRLRFRYSNIRRIIVSEEKGSVDLIFLLTCPPAIYLKNARKGSKSNFLRVDTIVGASANTIGRSNAIRLKMPDDIKTQQILSRLFFRCGKKPIAYTTMNIICDTSDHLSSTMPNVDLHNFRCTYMLTSLLWRTLSVQLQNWDNLVQRASQFARDSPDILFQVLCDLVSLCDEGAILDYVLSLENLMDFYTYKKEDLELGDKAFIKPDNTSHVWRATITPTRCLLWPPALLFGNRVLRNFDPKYALRVVFRDEDERKLNLCAGAAHPDFYNMAVVAPLTEGIMVGPRTFQFLGWSNSQIREHGVWTYAKDTKGVTAAEIRNWMGDFSHIQSVPKFMARMGLCFTHTKQGVTVPLHQNCIRFEADIKGGTNPENQEPYCFTDGVGKISNRLLKEVCEALKYEGEVLPSAIQFRYGGCKGMLVLDPTLQDVDIVIRESQNKFPCSGSQELEVCKVSSPVAVNLNRQLISILDHMGIPTGVFLKLQEDMLESATVILLDSHKAVEYLISHCALNKLHYRNLYSSGLELNSEPFFRTLLLALHWKVVQGIKAKARLEIPPDYGRNMFGVVDETGKLEYGQVFVQYSTDVTKQTTTSDTKILQGKAVITKNPCLQPGDVRVLEAVDILELHHIVDCVVFPQKGPRPHPSEMAGSDLDGDEYTVIWYESLIFPGDNAPASHFPIPKDKIKQDAIDEKDMLGFLANYIRNDQVGLIGNAHLANSDRLGLGNPVLKSMAHKFSIAVDFVKNGQLVTLDEEERVHSYPDFMNKEGQKPTYRSKRALGKLFRVCRDFQEDGEFHGLAYRDVMVDKDFIFPGWERFEESAKKLRSRYNRLMDLVLSSNGLNHEAEAIAQANVKLQEQRDRADVEELVLESVRTIWAKIEREFMAEFPPTTPAEDLYMLILQKASACYFVTYADPNPINLSFAWIMSTELHKIRMKNLQLSPCREPTKSFTFKLEEKIFNCVQDNQVSPMPEDLQELDGTEDPVVLLCLRIIFHWARHHKLISDSTPSDVESSTLLKKERQMWSVREIEKTYFFIVKTIPKPVSLIGLLIRYLQSMIKLRFQITPEKSKSDANELKLKFLGRKAMYTYHCLAISGNLSVLGLDLSKDPLTSEDQELGPICLSSDFVKKHEENKFSTLKNRLMELTGASAVYVRQQKRTFLLSAIGSGSALKAVREAISKGHPSLLSA